MVPAILAVVVIQFALMQAAPGDIAVILAGENQDPVYLASVRERYGLDQPVLVQLFIYLGRLARGDLGESFLYGRPVIDVILSRAPATLLLMLTAIVISSVLGTLIGAFAAWTGRRALGELAGAAGVISYSIPVFWVGLVFILVFSVHLRWLPTSGMMSPQPPDGPLERALDIGRHLILPVATLCTFHLGQYVRLARSTVGEVLRSEYVTAARAIGYSSRTILLRFGLRNAMLPMVTLVGLQLGTALAGAILTETVFSWPGLGTLIYQAILARDLPLVIGSYTVISVGVIVMALATDTVYAMLDPRVSYR